MKSKIIICIFLSWFIFNPISLKAAENYDSYELSSSKLNGLKYELSDSSITNDKLYLKGWSYIDNAQNYLNSKDLLTTIGIQGSDGYRGYYQATISDEYSMTGIEYFENAEHEWCKDSEYNQTADQCNHKYEYVTYEVSIPLSIFNPGVTYEFYIYTKALDEGSKMYTKLYADDLNFSKTINGITYHGESNLDITNLMVNDEYVIVRDKAGKTSKPFTDNLDRTYYFTKSKIYDFIDTKVVDNVTWYQLKIATTSKKLSTRYLAIPGNEYRGWIASPYLDFSGNGNFQLTVSSEANASIDAIYSEVLSENSGNVGVDVTFEKYDDQELAKITMNYNGTSQTQSFNAKNGKYHFDFNIDPQYIKQGASIYISLYGNYYDSNSSDNSFSVTSLYPSQKKVEIDKSQPIKAVSGMKVDRGKTKLYYETISVNYNNLIDSIDSSIGDYNADFSKYYSGGAFRHEIDLVYNNDYPHSSYTFIPTNVSISLNDLENILDTEEIINYEYDGEKYIIPKLKLTNKGLMLDSEGQNLLLTKLSLDPGEYIFDSVISNVGVNKLDITLHTQIDIAGHLLGNSRNNLFYYREIVSNNPMPNYTSSLWQENMATLNNAISNNDPYHEITISKLAIQDIKDSIEKDYANNINNDELLQIKYDELVTSGNIKEVQ